MSELQPKVELNWPAIRATVTDPDAALALYVHVEQEANGLKLIHAGFEPNHANRCLKEWRRDYWMLNNDLTERALLTHWPAVKPVLAAIRAGQYDLEPVLKPAPLSAVPPAPQPQPQTETLTTEEVQPMPRGVYDRSAPKARTSEPTPAPASQPLAKRPAATLTLPDEMLRVHVERPGLFFHVETTETEIYESAVASARQFVQGGVPPART